MQAVSGARNHITPLVLYEGDHLNRAFARLGWGARKPSHLCLRMLLVFAITWLPMAIIAVTEGLYRPPLPANFFADFAAYAQFFVGLPLFIVAEAVVIRTTSDAGMEMAGSGILRHPGKLDALDGLHRRVARLRDAWWIELICVLMAFQLSGWILGVELLRHGPVETWHTRWLDSSTRIVTWTGAWAFFVALPVLNYWWLRHVARTLIWTWYLYRVSRLKLDLLATHPDRTGGIGFISDVQAHFAWTIFAYGLTNVAAPVGYQIAVLRLDPFVLTVWAPMFGFAIGAPALFLGPLFLFTHQLAVTRMIARRHYRRLLLSETRRMESRALPLQERRRIPPQAADVAAVNQLAQIYQRVADMRVVPFDFRSLVQLLSSSFGSVATVLPLMHAEGNFSRFLAALGNLLGRLPFAH